MRKATIFELPPGRLRSPNFEHLSVEEIYELLLKNTDNCLNSLKLLNPDLLNEAPGDIPPTPLKEGGLCDRDSTFVKEELCDIPPTPLIKGGLNSDRPNSLIKGGPNNSNHKHSLSEKRKAALEEHWQNALQQASVIARTVNQGVLPAGIERELGALNAAQINWRSYLWRYLVQTPTDFSGFDRRFIGRGLYLEALQGENIQVYVAVDTSGSIDNQQLSMFLSEVGGILSSYPHLKCELYYVDAEAYGPYELNSDMRLPKPEGGGGTSFVPFFEKVAESWDGFTQSVCIYLTDGYGSFPDIAPQLPVLWVVTPGGLELEGFPFGEAVRLLS